MSQDQTPQQRPAAPPRYKMALVTWIGAYAAITTILYELGPAMVTWPLYLRTLLISVLMVVTLTWVLIPLLTRVFRGWLMRTPTRATRVRAPHRRRKAAHNLQPSNA